MKATEEMRRLGPEHPDWNPQYCGYLKDDGTYCCAWRRSFVDGTFADRCRHHGGGNKKQILSAHGSMKKSSYILRREVAAKFRAFKNLTDKLDLFEEIDIFRAYLAQGIEKWSEKDELSFEEIGWVMEKIERLARLVEIVVRIRNTTALTIAEVHYIQITVANVLKQYIPPEHLERALEDLYKITQMEPTQLKPYYDTIEDGEVVHHPESTLAPDCRYLLNVIDDPSFS